MLNADLTLVVFSWACFADSASFSCGYNVEMPRYWMRKHLERLSELTCILFLFDLWGPVWMKERFRPLVRMIYFSWSNIVKTTGLLILVYLVERCSKNGQPVFWAWTLSVLRMVGHSCFSCYVPSTIKGLYDKLHTGKCPEKIRFPFSRGASP